MIRYFIVDRTGEAAGAGPRGLESGEADFFWQLDEDIGVAEEDARAEANTVHDFDCHQSAVVRG